MFMRSLILDFGYSRHYKFQNPVGGLLYKMNGICQLICFVWTLSQMNLHGYRVKLTGIMISSFETTVPNSASNVDLWYHMLK